MARAVNAPREAAVPRPPVGLRRPGESYCDVILAPLIWVAPLDRLGSPEGSSNYVLTPQKRGCLLAMRSCPRGADYGTADHNCVGSELVSF